MKRFLQKLRHIIRGQPVEPHVAEPQNDAPYICGTALFRMKAEQRERDLASCQGEKPQQEDKQ